MPISCPSECNHPVGISLPVLITLNLLPVLRGGRADLETSEEDLVTVLPHDEGTDGTDDCLGQVQHDLEQEVERECPGDHLTVADPLVGEGAGYWVVSIQPAHAVLFHLIAVEAAGL